MASTSNDVKLDTLPCVKTEDEEAVPAGLPPFINFTNKVVALPIVNTHYASTVQDCSPQQENINDSSPICGGSDINMTEHSTFNVASSAQQCEDDILELEFTKLSDRAFTPMRMGEAGYDLFAAHNHMLPANEKCLVRFDLLITIPSNFYARIVGRLTRSLVYSIVGADNVISSGKDIPLILLLFNLSKSNLIIGRGDRVGTLMLHHLVPYKIKEVTKTS